MVPEQINILEPHYASKSDADVLQAAHDLKTKVAQDGLLDEHRNHAFALVREAAKRTLRQRHYDVQLMAGAALAQGFITEMGTGEGKTLASTAPVFFHALTGRGVHVITVNDYLAQRDAVWMGQIYAALGMRTACIVHDMAYEYDPLWQSPSEQELQKEDESRDTKGNFHIERSFLRPITRREAYQADIVYGTNSEFGFDYLRDNLAYQTGQQVQRGHYFAIIDEVDSILIDEARTPLIISAPDTEAAHYYTQFAHIVRALSPETDYVVDEKNRFVSITDTGVEAVERVLGIDNLYDMAHVRLVHYLEESLKARALFLRDRNYVVHQNQIIIIDEFTGRMMQGRRYSGGLHQALEAKEGVPVQQESKTFAQITIQNYFRLYEKIAGMTGTAETSSEEFNKVYGLEVVVIPPNKKRIRADRPDLVYQNKEAKYKAIVEKVALCAKNGQPVLVGTTSIDENELLSEQFSRAGIAHEVLNAKNHEREGEIIAQAGRAGRVTLATNMAGRGVDIILGGNPPDTQEAEGVRAAGGLFVLGTQRNDARRIDNQLRGRSGRQGDPGETQFFLSLEDDMFRIFGGERIQRLMGGLKLPPEVPIESSMVVRAINEAQKKVEGLHFDARKHLLEYDDVLNRQRVAVYRRRQGMLESIEKGETVRVLEEMVLHFIEAAKNAYEQEQAINQPSNQPETVETFLTTRLQAIKILQTSDTLHAEDITAIEAGELPQTISTQIEQAAQHPETGARILASLDMYWTNHLENLEALLESVRMRAYGQRDPLVEYKRESYELFKNLITDAETWVVSNVFVLTDEQIRAQQQVVTLAPSAKDPHAGIGRNDPCWCGSGKKFKRCHGMNTN
ncbi:MAG: preprotein translocase subunit SecA [Patescibacteria group bacterium]|nr:preprotein translocase subunit SecA [Patescibacteria group bacterium]